MLTLEQFHSLEEGDLIEAGPLFEALTPDSIVLHTHKKVDTPESCRREFVVTYLGITLGRWTCHLMNGELVWDTK